MQLILVYFLLASLHTTLVRGQQYQKFDAQEDVLLQCGLSASSSIIWTKNGSPISSSENRVVYSTGRVEFKPARESDAAVYECIAPDELRDSITLTYITLESGFEKHIGDNVTMNCVVKGGNPTLVWLKNERQLSSSSRVTINEGVLRIVNLSLSDSADYRCDVVYNGATRHYKNSQLLVTAIPENNDTEKVDPNSGIVTCPGNVWAIILGVIVVLLLIVIIAMILWLKPHHQLYKTTSNDVKKEPDESMSLSTTNNEPSNLQKHTV